MLSKNKIKYIKSLGLKKQRDAHKVFVAEGDKCISELIETLTPEILVYDAQKTNLDVSKFHCECIASGQDDIKKISNLKTARASFAIFQYPTHKLHVGDLSSQLSLVLDGIQDPGNMGTIIRVADWFGIKNLVCSIDTVDVYNPKVVQATMGALARVNVHYTCLVELVTSFSGNVYGTYLEGDNIYQTKLDSAGLIVMGNEGAGIRPELEKHISQKLFIPPYPQHASKVESLNVGTATSIICSEFRRRMF